MEFMFHVCVGEEEERRHRQGSRLASDSYQLTLFLALWKRRNSLSEVLGKCLHFHFPWGGGKESCLIPHQERLQDFGPPVPKSETTLAGRTT